MADDPISGRFPNRRHDAVLAEARRAAADIRRRAERDAQVIRRDAAEWAATTRRQAEEYRDRLLLEADRSTEGSAPEPEPVPDHERKPPATEPPDTEPPDTETRDLVASVLAEHRRRRLWRTAALALVAFVVVAAGAVFVAMNLPDTEADVANGEAASEVRVPETVATVPGLVDLPSDVRGRPLAEVIDDLKGSGLDFTFDRVFDDEVPAGAVVSMAGSFDARVPQGTTVPLLVSRGPARPRTPVLRVPDVVGRSFDEAVALLEEAGLTAGVIHGRGDGAILDQAPDAGTRVEPGAAVNLRRGP